jgi:hypothetical protein
MRTGDAPLLRGRSLSVTSRGSAGTQIFREIEESTGRPRVASEMGVRTRKTFASGRGVICDYRVGRRVSRSYWQ